jgi:hypothetical protein
MNEIAEKGLAAHYKYKEGGPASGGDEDRFDKWFGQIREVIGSPDTDSVDFLQDFKTSFLADFLTLTVFVVFNTCFTVNLFLTVWPLYVAEIVYLPGVIFEGIFRIAYPSSSVFTLKVYLPILMVTISSSSTNLPVSSLTRTLYVCPSS